MQTIPVLQRLPDRFDADPTEDQLALLRRRRELAVASPIGPEHKRIPFMSMNVHLESTASVEKRTTSSRNPVRPLDQDLLRVLGEADDRNGFELFLEKQLRGGENEWSQVWTCNVQREGKLVGRVVVKFLAEYLFPFPQDAQDSQGAYTWQSANAMERREAKA